MSVGWFVGGYKGYLWCLLGLIVLDEDRKRVELDLKCRLLSLQRLLL